MNNMMVCGWARDRVRDYDSLQSVAVLLLYIQIGCGVIGCVGAWYNGVAAMNASVALFALVAIESSSQRLGRIYATLLLVCILIDLLWLFLFAHSIWSMSSEEHGSYFVFSVKLTLAMQMMGCSVRVLSSFLWIQMYRLGVEAAAASRDDLRNSFLSPPAPPAVARQSSGSDEVLGGSIYDPSYYSSLFEDARFSTPGQNHSDASPRRLSAGRSIQCGDNHGNGCASSADGSPLKGRSFPSVDEDKSFRM